MPVELLNEPKAKAQDSEAIGVICACVAVFIYCGWLWADSAASFFAAVIHLITNLKALP